MGRRVPRRDEFEPLRHEVGARRCAEHTGVHRPHFVEGFRVEPGRLHRERIDRLIGLKRVNEEARAVSGRFLQNVPAGRAIGLRLFRQQRARRAAQRISVRLVDRDFTREPAHVGVVEVAAAEAQAERRCHAAADVERQVRRIVQRFGVVVHHERQEIRRREHRAQALDVVPDVGGRRRAVVHPRRIAVADHPQVEAVAAA